jgi:hypothetical protein
MVLNFDAHARVIIMYCSRFSTVFVTCPEFVCMMVPVRVVVDRSDSANECRRFGGGFSHGSGSSGFGTSASSLPCPDIFNINSCSLCLSSWLCLIFSLCF